MCQQGVYLPGETDFSTSLKITLWDGYEILVIAERQDEEWKTSRKQFHEPKLVYSYLKAPFSQLFNASLLVANRDASSIFIPFQMQARALHNCLVQLGLFLTHSGQLVDRHDL